MNESTFWTIMSESNEISNGNPIVQQELISEKLNKFSPDELVRFDKIFQKFRNNAYTWNLWAAAYIINGGCSDDCFMDFRGWLIGQGEEVYRKALSDPDSLSSNDNLEDGMEWEGYGYITLSIYESKTGTKMPINSEERHHPEPAGDEWDESELGDLLPKLSTKFNW